MVLLMLLAYPLARLSVRRAHFNRFWWSHQLLLLWTLLLVLHGRTAWLEPSQALSWVGLPLGVYLLERARRSVGREVAVAPLATRPHLTPPHTHRSSPRLSSPHLSYLASSPSTHTPPLLAPPRPTPPLLLSNKDS